MTTQKGNEKGFHTEKNNDIIFSSYRLIYCDEIIDAIKDIGAITGKRNNARVSRILKIFESLEARNLEGSCMGEICPKYEECFRG